MAAKLLAAAAALFAAGCYVCTLGGLWPVLGGLGCALGVLLLIAGVGFLKDPAAVAAVEARMKSRSGALPVPDGALADDSGTVVAAVDVPTAPANREQRRAADRATRQPASGKRSPGKR